MTKSRLREYTVFPLAIGLFLTLLAGAAAAYDDPTPRIIASGEGVATLAPDMAILSLTVTREGETARSALDESSTAMAQVISAMSGEGVAERDLQTSGFSIQPKYVYPKPRAENPPRIAGYTVRNSLTVRVRDLGRLGVLLDKSVTLGVNEGGNVRFANDDPSAAQAQARTAAVKDAMARARTMAIAAGVEPGKVLEISESSYHPQPRPMMESMAMARSADAGSVPLATGENTYRVVVTLSLEIKQ